MTDLPAPAPEGVTGSAPARNSDAFARTRPTARARGRDPLGKAALFSTGAPDAGAPAPLGTTGRTATDREGRGASHLFSHTEARPGTVVLECSACAQCTRVSYTEFAALHFPVWAWVPSPRRSHRHWLRCPACRRFTWVRAGWLE